MKKQQREKMQKIIIYFILLTFLVGILPIIFGR